MDDIIRRSDAIKAITGEPIDSHYPSWYVDKLKGVPSAQSLALTCDGCRFVGILDTEFPCSRCIRREKDYYAQER